MRPPQCPRQVVLVAIAAKGYRGLGRSNRLTRQPATAASQGTNNGGTGVTVSFAQDSTEHLRMRRLTLDMPRQNRVTQESTALRGIIRASISEQLRAHYDVRLEFPMSEQLGKVVESFERVEDRPIKPSED